MWNFAADCIWLINNFLTDLNLIDKAKTAPEKMGVLLKTTDIVADILKNSSKEATSADTIFPIMISIILRAKPKRL